MKKTGNILPGLAEFPTYWVHRPWSRSWKFSRASRLTAEADVARWEGGESPRFSLCGQRVAPRIDFLMRMVVKTFSTSGGITMPHGQSPSLTANSSCSWLPCPWAMPRLDPSNRPLIWPLPMKQGVLRTKGSTHLKHGPLGHILATLTSAFSSQRDFLSVLFKFSAAQSSWRWAVP